MAVSPVPKPTTTPQSRASCQTSVMTSDPITPAAISASAVAATRRMPKRFMKAAAKGPIRPKSSRRMAKAPEISAADQPNSCCRGPISTPGAPTAPAVTSMVRKAVPATTQP